MIAWKFVDEKAFGWVLRSIILCFLVVGVFRNECLLGQGYCEDPPPDPDPPCYASCCENCPDDDENDIEIPIIRSFDPNDILGPVGVDSVRWVSAEDRLYYTIRFENSQEFATAAAREVRITSPLDENMNPFSFRVEGFGFGTYFYEVPNGPPFYTDRLFEPLDSLGVVVDISAGVDIIDSRSFWTFRSIDPTTGFPPQDAELGFLAVNDTSVNQYNDTLIGPGEGYVSFSIGLRPVVQTGDTVKADASIVFDENEAIETNIWSNVIDAGRPESMVLPIPLPLPDTLGPNAVALAWEGMDDVGGSGLDSYSLYASEDDGPYALIASGLEPEEPPFVFMGEPGIVYRFYSLATDRVGNVEFSSETEDAITEFGVDFCLGDLNGDGYIAVADLLLLLQAWGTEASYTGGDFDGNGFISIMDVLTMLELYGTSCF